MGKNTQEPKELLEEQEKPSTTQEPAIEADTEKIIEESPLPEELNEGIEATTTKTMKQLIKEKLAEIKDMATLEVRLPIGTRLKKRMDTIRKMSQAEHTKIEGHFYTEKPKMFISQLDGRKISSEEAIITFKVYETDEKGNKKPTFQKVTMEREDGSTYEKISSAEYRIAYEVKMTIPRNKPIIQEITRFIPKGGKN